MTQRAQSHPDTPHRPQAIIAPQHGFRLWLGFAISIMGIGVLFNQFWVYAQQQPAVLQALGGGMVAALATALGSVPVMLSQRMSERTQDTFLGFGAGVMLAACAFSLIMPGMAAVREHGIWGGSNAAATGIVGAAILLGAAAMLLMDRMLPHEHFVKGREGMDLDMARKLQRTWLFVFAIALHNLPEGLAIGAGYASNGAAGNLLATGIAIQDVPEGLVVAVALLAAGYSRKTAVVLAMLTGLVEPIGAVIGAMVVSTSLEVLPWGLGFAAGAMLFVISHEIIPESHRKGHETFATGGLMLGFVLMMVMDTAFA